MLQSQVYYFIVYKQSVVLLTDIVYLYVITLRDGKLLMNAYRCVEVHLHAFLTWALCKPQIRSWLTLIQSLEICYWPLCISSGYHYYIYVRTDCLDLFLHCILSLLEQTTDHYELTWHNVLLLRFFFSNWCTGQKIDGQNMHHFLILVVFVCLFVWKAYQCVHTHTHIIKQSGDLTL